MASLQEERKLVVSPRKRKWQDEGEAQDHQESKRVSLAHHLDLMHLDAPLPLEWQRCLDLKSGQIHFYNTRTHKRTSQDPRSSPESPAPTSGPSLDLELNLNGTCSPRVPAVDRRHSSGNMLSWISLDAGGRQDEMVAAVCVRCHMLVMMRKAAPSCPNCKFLHPQGQSSPPLLSNKPGFRLLCCKD